VDSGTVLMLRKSNFCDDCCDLELSGPGAPPKDHNPILIFICDSTDMSCEMEEEFERQYYGEVSSPKLKEAIKRINLPLSKRGGRIIRAELMLFDSKYQEVFDNMLLSFSLTNGSKNGDFLTPAQVVDNFFHWYIYGGGEGDDLQERDDVTEGYKEKIMGIKDHNYDPVMLYQDSPGQGFSVVEALIIGEKAYLEVFLHYFFDDIIYEVELNLIDNNWKINDIIKKNTITG